VKNVVLPLVLVITISLVFSTQDAFAVEPNCTVDDGTIQRLSIDQMYIATTNGKLAKLQIGGLPMTDKGKWCEIGDFKVNGMGDNKKCTDIALDSSVPRPYPLYCVTFMDDSRLYSVDRKTGVLTEIGLLLSDCDVTKQIKQINTLEIDTAGVVYAGGFNGRLWNVDLNTGCLTFRALILDPLDNKFLNLSGDGAFDLIDANLFITSQNCKDHGHVECANGDDGLYKINLVTFDATFIGTTGQKNAFAMDMLPFNGNLCGVTKGGTLFEIKQNADPVLSLATSNIIDGSLLFANGGTALQQLVGGILVQINKLNLLVSLIFS